MEPDLTRYMSRKRLILTHRRRLKMGEPGQITAVRRLELLHRRFIFTKARFIGLFIERRFKKCISVLFETSLSRIINYSIGVYDGERLIYILFN